MARIPDANDIGRRIPDVARGVASADITAPSRALQGLGQSLERVGGQIQQKEDQFNYAEAQSNFLKRKLDIMASFDGDNDYPTFGDRYNEQISKAREESAGLLVSNSDKRLFEIESNNDIARGYDQVRGLVRNKEVDFGRATLDQTITSNREAAISAKDESTRMGLINATNDAIIGAHSRGYISAEQAQQIKQRSAVDYATASVSSLTPKEQVSALKSGAGIAALIPLDTRKKMLDQAAWDSVNERIGNVKISLMNPEALSGFKVGNAINSDDLFSAVIGQESGGRQFGNDGKPLTSGKGATGIAQVMPATGPEAAALAGLPWDPARHQNDANYNASLGKAYLNQQLKKYGGNPVLALAAYNAGPGKVDEWISRFGDPRKGQITDESFANSIPYAETQNYVSSVLSNASKLSAAKSIIDSPEFADLDGVQKTRAVEQTYNVIDTATSAQRFNIQQRMQDDVARVNSGKPVENPVTISDFTSAQQLNSTPADRAQAYQQFNQYQQTLALQPAYQTVISSPANVGIETVNGLMPATGDADFAFKQQRYTAVAQKYQQVIAAREKDPGGWMVQNIPTVSEAYQNYQSDPSTGAQLAHQVLMEKQRLGIKNKDVLPDSLVNGILQQIDNNKEQDVAAIQSLGQQFGPYSQQVMQQVQKKSGPVLQVVMATNNPRAANALWQNRDVKTAELRSSINSASSGAAESADTEWASQSKDFSATMVGQPGGVPVWNNFNDQGRRLTYLNMQKGMSASDAASQAYQDILGSQYQTKGTWRLPVAANTDMNDVSDGVDAFMSKLKPADITPLIGDPRLSNEVNQQQSLNRIKDNAEWVTNADETGLMLTLNGLIVSGADGNPVTASFADLAQLGSTNRGYFNQLSKEVNKPRAYTPGQAAKESQARNEETARQLGRQGTSETPSMAEGMRDTNANLHQRSGTGNKPANQ
ncbi:transglycosylase SLT domain-containing protein [Yersinia kristensenii]|uniref:transglycosylase SLT domain-containing protein n=1 Tax=Yersinia kristensenii TaxID=28152 RepID=UPI0005E58087|nr:transglycosylase SLT domain-containing protein [Yersinia kristensenii]CFR19933.1 lytic murein transglycosylase [Yersinia kristensenii]